MTYVSEEQMDVINMIMTEIKGRSDWEGLVKSHLKIGGAPWEYHNGRKSGFDCVLNYLRSFEVSEAEE